MTHAIVLAVALLAGCASLEELARQQAEQARRQAAEDMAMCREIFGLAADDPQLVTCAHNQSFLRQWQVMQLRRISRVHHSRRLLARPEGMRQIVATIDGTVGQ